MSGSSVSMSANGTAFIVSAAGNDANATDAMDTFDTTNSVKQIEYTHNLDLILMAKQPMISLVLQ